VTIDDLKSLVERQATDAGLWCDPKSATERYLQMHLRMLHRAIEELE
jgi:hypothetical protein